MEPTDFLNGLNGIYKGTKVMCIKNDRWYKRDEAPLISGDRFDILLDSF